MGHRTAGEILSDKLLEVLAAFLLSIAGVAASWSAYQVSIWSGVQAASYAQASTLRVESTRKSAEASVMRMIDVSMFMQWMNARAERKTELENFYRSHFRPEFRPAFEAWLASDPSSNHNALPTPFVHPLYKVLLQEVADEMSNKADAMFEKGRRANVHSDDYALNTVIIALVMFFSGIARLFPSRWLQLTLLLLASVMAVWGGWHLWSFPVARY